MNIDLKLFLTSLKHQNFSKSSLKNYKTDVLQFINWKISEELMENTYRSVFNIYKQHLNTSYKKSSCKRKIASISKFLEFAEPMPTHSPTTIASNNKSYLRNALLLGGYSLALASILIIGPMLSNNPKIESTYIPDVKTISTDYEDIETSGIKVTISAPVEFNQTEDRVALSSSTSEDKSNNSNHNEFGLGIIQNNSKSITIYSDSVNPDSFVYITPISNPYGNILFVESQGDGWFKVSISNITDKAIEFKWAVINDTSVSKLL